MNCGGGALKCHQKPWKMLPAASVKAASASAAARACQFTTSISPPRISSAIVATSTTSGIGKPLPAIIPDTAPKARILRTPETRKIAASRQRPTKLTISVMLISQRSEAHRA